MDSFKDSLINQIKGAATIPVDSTDGSLQQLSTSTSKQMDSFLEKMTVVTEELVSELRTMNDLVSEQIKVEKLLERENQAESKALSGSRISKDDAFVLVVEQITSIFSDLILSLQNLDLSGGGGGGFDTSWFDTKKAGVLAKNFLKGASRLFAAASLAYVAKDGLDIATGSDGGANNENIFGLVGAGIGAIAGLGAGLAVAGITGGSGIVAIPTLVSAGMVSGNEVGNSWGADLDARQAEHQAQPQTPIVSNTTNIFQSSQRSPAVSAEDRKLDQVLDAFEQTRSNQSAIDTTFPIENYIAPKLEKVTEAAMQDEERVAVLPPIDQSSGQQINPSPFESLGTQNQLSSSDVPDPNYYGVGLNLLVEMI